MSSDYFYDLLKAGKTPDDITKMLNAAQQKIRKEEAEEKKRKAEAAEKEKAISSTRHALAVAITEYAKALSVDTFSEKDTNDILKILEDILKEIEKNKDKHRNPIDPYFDFFF